ncbi:MAG: hypothetical protein U0930_12465 [Pirellulales bacterium]
MTDSQTSDVDLSEEATHSGGLSHSGPAPVHPIGLPQSLTGKEIVRLMRKNGKTIESLSFRMGIPQKRIRQIREKGTADVLAIRDWMEAITGVDPGPIPEKIRICGTREEGNCCYCGCPLYSGDEAFEYVGSMFCSTTCCRKSRGW